MSDPKDEKEKSARYVDYLTTYCGMNIITDLSQRVLTQDHLPYEQWEKAQLDILEAKEICTSYELEILRARPEVWRAVRAEVRLPAQALSEEELEKLAEILSADVDV